MLFEPLIGGNLGEFKVYASTPKSFGAVRWRALERFNVFQRFSFPQPATFYVVSAFSSVDLDLPSLKYRRCL
jgi:hypothetical protein